MNDVEQFHQQRLATEDSERLDRIEKQRAAFERIVARDADRFQVDAAGNFTGGDWGAYNRFKVYTQRLAKLDLKEEALRGRLSSTDGESAGTQSLAPIKGQESDVGSSDVSRLPQSKIDPDVEIKTVCHLGSPAEQGFYVDGPPRPIES